MIYVLYGAASSGKSEWAEGLAIKLKPDGAVYLATMQRFGAAEEKIIEKHRAKRKGKGFVTVEKPCSLCSLSFSESDCVLLEDIPNLVSNEMFAYNKKQVAFEDAYANIKQGLDYIFDSAGNTVIVTGNLFEDGGIYDSATDSYLRLLGRTNMYIAGVCDVFAEIASGIPVFYKGRFDL